MRLVCVLATMLLCGAAAGAAKVEVVEAVLPDWPAQAAVDAKGTVRVKFALVPGSEVFILEADSDELSREFVDESRLAMREWLVKDRDGVVCGMVRGEQEFRFDGAAADPVALGETRAWISGDGAPVHRLDRVEITGGRILRSQANDAEALARDKSIQDGYWERRNARWKAAMRDKVISRYAPEGITPPVPKVRIEPQWPRSALQRGQSGEVVARLSIDARGRVAKVEIADSYPRGTFDQASRRALARWQFEPAVDRDGHAIVLEVCQQLSYIVINEGRFRQGER